MTTQQAIHTAADALSDRRQLYRHGDAKPAAIPVTAEQFDAICDVCKAAQRMLDALDAIAHAPIPVDIDSDGAAMLRAIARDGLRQTQPPAQEVAA